MSKRGLEFAEQWVSENIDAGPYAPDGEPHPEAQDAVTRLLAAAKEQGISREEIEEDTGDLEDFLSESYEDATDDEVQRLVDKDPY